MHATNTQTSAIACTVCTSATACSLLHQSSITPALCALLQAALRNPAESSTYQCSSNSSSRQDSSSPPATCRSGSGSRPSSASQPPGCPANSLVNSVVSALLNFSYSAPLCEQLLQHGVVQQLVRLLQALVNSESNQGTKLVNRVSTYCSAAAVLIHPLLKLQDITLPSLKIKLGAFFTSEYSALHAALALHCSLVYCRLLRCFGTCLSWHQPRRYRCWLPKAVRRCTMHPPHSNRYSWRSNSRDCPAAKTQSRLGHPAPSQLLQQTYGSGSLPALVVAPAGQQQAQLLLLTPSWQLTAKQRTSHLAAQQQRMHVTVLQHQNLLLLVLGMAALICHATEQQLSWWRCCQSCSSSSYRTRAASR